MKSVRLLIGGRRQDRDVSIELGSDDFRDFKIETKPGSDGSVLLDISFRIESDANRIEGQCEETAYQAALGPVNYASGDIIGVCNQGFLRHSYFSGLDEADSLTAGRGFNQRLKEGS